LNLVQISKPQRKEYFAKVSMKNGKTMLSQTSNKDLRETENDDDDNVNEDWLDYLEVKIGLKVLGDEGKDEGSAD